MNQDEDVPTRVTRGALRRRSVDQEATPQKPTGAAVSGTPKKTNSTSKRVVALNAIQESESGRPSTPIVGRTTRRRMSETIDTPTSLPNKLVQNLKEAESKNGEPGRRSRNTSLTEENLNELNATYERNSTTLTTRPRTPARLRASHEALTSIGSPQPPVTGVRRSTRRNSVTSDDGNSSVQSLPVTVSKMGTGVRALKDDTIIEEDDRDTRAESVSSDTSTRQKRAQSALSAVSAASPRSTPASPVCDVTAESSPPSGKKTPRIAITPLSLSKLSPRSKNVSFSDDSKRDDHQSSLPKTPTSVTKQMFVVVEDLRNSELMCASPRVTGAVNASSKMVESEKKGNPVNASPKCENMVSQHQPPTTETVASVSKDEMNDSTTSMIDDKDKMNDSTTSMIVLSNGECAEETSIANNVSGIEVLEASVKDTENTTVTNDNGTVTDGSRTADQSLSEGNKFSASWSQSVRRSATKGIDEYSIRKQEEQERLEEEKATLQKVSLDSSLETRSPVTKQQSSELKKDGEDTSEEEENEEEETRERNEFVDDEALEVEDYQSCDSMDSELRKEIAENEVPEQGEDLGSEDTEEEPEDDEEDDNDSWLVSDGEEMEPMEEDELLQSSNDDVASMVVEEDSAQPVSKQPKKATRRRRIVDPVDDSDEEEKASSPTKSPKRNNTTNTRRSATPALGGENLNLTPTKKSVAAESHDDIVKPVDKTTPNVKAASKETFGVGEKIETSGGVPTTPSAGKKLPAKIALKSPSPVTMVSTIAVEDEKQSTDPIADEEQEEAKDCSKVMIEDVKQKEESDIQNDREEMECGETSALSSLLSKSPKKPINSRKSLPAKAANITEPQSVVADARKSLPASAKLFTAHEKTAQSDENALHDELLERNESVEEVVDLDEYSEDETALSPDKKKTPNESLAVEITLDQPSNNGSSTGRKSMPPVSLISAQFYIGAAKKRNTIGGGNTNAMTSTPKQPEKEKASTEKNKNNTNTPVAKKMVATDGNCVVPNPFALAKGGKPKSRVSLDSGVAVADSQQQQQAVKKARLSLPAKLIEETPSPSQSEPASQQPAPEPMEVDEVPDEEENVTNGEKHNGEMTDDDDDENSVQEVQSTEKQRTKAPKPKAKALEDYDLTNILVRCNEFVREDKERKKQLASVLRKKKEEKKKQRELEQQQELEAAKAAAANALAANKDDPNSTNASTGNDSTGQVEELLKKKKKRKPKKVNYLLEELAETKKERMEQALRRKLEVVERRKQRKKERQLEKKMQDKENGHGGANVPTVAASGIGAKLEKLKKKSKPSKQQDKLKEPPVRVALSAFAVFNQVPTNQVELSSPSIVEKDGKQTKADESPVEKKQKLKVTETVNETKKLMESAEKSPKEKAIVKKKASLVPQPEEALIEADKRDTSVPYLTLQPAAAGDGMPKEVGKISKKQKKQATKTSSNGDSELRNEIVEVMAQSTEPARKVEKPKGKKVKEQVVEFPLQELGSSSSIVPKQKKSKKMKQLEAAAAEKLSSAMAEVRAEREKISNVKKTNKQFASLQEEKLAVEQEALVVPTKKRKREQQGGDNSSVASTPRPAKHTKLRVLQRIESGGFFEESVTPHKLRLKRNFGFDERQATPAKQLGFRVSSLLPSGQDELRGMATSSFKISTKQGGNKPSKFGDVVATGPNASLPLPVWTSSGIFLESAIDGDGNGEKKKAQKSKPISSTAAESGYIQLKTQGKGDFSLKKLRPGPIAEKPHRVDPTTTGQSVLNFKRQQLLEKTAHLRDKKKSHIV
ncbi:titin homolog [Anopheles maculipalpis]|uniref:titin homolog n=1 Tax=Anopheles maculipalpis TaxID=1496333 RepID=UPI0021595FBD|nr:titin homolog [Anopheles maculipalpis]